MKLTWDKLSEKDKLAYKGYCDSKYGESFTRLPNGEPVYLNEDGNMYKYEDIVRHIIRDNRSKRLEGLFKLL